MVAAPYAEEVWTGVEYMSASHMIMRGLVDEGLAIVRAARDRHDGSRRNPWNDIECGSYYARSMSAWQLVNAFSGLHADFVAGRLAFAPKAAGRLPPLLVRRHRLRHPHPRRRQRSPSTSSAARLSVAEIAVDGRSPPPPTGTSLAAGTRLDLHLEP